VPEQLSLIVTPSTSTYIFSFRGVELQLNFTSPFIPSNDTITGRQATYITASASSSDGASHNVELYFDVTGQLSTDSDTEPLTWQRQASNGNAVLQMGATTQ